MEDDNIEEGPTGTRWTWRKRRRIKGVSSEDKKYDKEGAWRTWRRTTK
jgi:hypothetical protein